MRDARHVCFTVSCEVNAEGGNYESVINKSEVCVGTKVIMPHITSDSDTISWLYVWFDTANQHKVCVNNKVIDTYERKLEVADGDSALILSNAQPEDSGWYVCIAESGRRLSKKVVVIVKVSYEFRMEQGAKIIFRY